jgi:hypothetical protein
MHSREILEAIQQALYRAGEILEAAAQPGKPSRIEAQPVRSSRPSRIEAQQDRYRGDPRG